MLFKNIEINNFRNFKSVNVRLDNKNIFFGLNDVGKTNFLYAVRYIFDKDIRKLNLVDSDFHCKNTCDPIEIIITIDISDLKCIDNQKLRAKLKGAIQSANKEVYIKLQVDYDDNEMITVPVLYWGGDRENLQVMKPRGYMFEIDYIMNVVYIDSFVDLNKLFKKNVNGLIKNSADDDKVLQDIESSVENLNMKIASLTGVKNFEKEITPEYK